MSGKSKAELNNEQKCEIHGISHHDCMSKKKYKYTLMHKYIYQFFLAGLPNRPMKVETIYVCFMS